MSMNVPIIMMMMTELMEKIFPKQAKEEALQLVQGYCLVLLLHWLVVVDLQREFFLLQLAGHGQVAVHVVAASRHDALRASAPSLLVA